MGKAIPKEPFMPQLPNMPISSHGAMPRRGFIASLGAALLLSGCVKAAKQIEGNWATSGTNADVINHDAWDKILADHARAADDGVNRIDYKAIKERSAAELSAYIKALENTKISEYPRDEQFAYWINLYNAATVQAIVSHYPLKSIRNIGTLGQGPWKDKSLKVEGRALSLDDIEHGILRPIWKDVRIHYAVNCASIGCPNLALKAYRAATLEAMLEEAARAYINHPRGFDQVDGKIVASSIFDWYQSDWGSAENVLSHARKYATGKTASILANAKSIDGYEYNWSLNDIG
jgi:hypothetical protein